MLIPAMVVDRTVAEAIWLTPAPPKSSPLEEALFEVGLRRVVLKVGSAGEAPKSALILVRRSTLTTVSTPAPTRNGGTDGLANG